MVDEVEDDTPLQWTGIEFEGRFFVWEGPFHDLKEADPHLPRLEFQQGLADAIQEAGHVPSYTDEPLGLSVVRETDRKSWHRRILGGGPGLKHTMVVDDPATTQGVEQLTFPSLA